jgi:hypothetical protein
MGRAVKIFVGYPYGGFATRMAVFSEGYMRTVQKKILVFTVIGLAGLAFSLAGQI